MRPGVRQPAVMSERIIRPASLNPLRLVTDVRTLLQYGDLIYTLSLHRVKVRYKHSVLGVSWAIFQPLSLMFIYTIVFSKIAGIQSDGHPYAVFALAALLPWTFFSTALSGSANALVSHSHLVTKVYFPREVIPISYVVASFFDFGIAGALLVVFMMYYHVPLTLNLAFLVPVVVLLTLLITTLALVLSAVQVRVRDAAVAMPLLLQLWMFVTPVVYPITAVPTQWRSVYELNPMVGIVENWRRILLNGEMPDLVWLGTIAAGVLVALPVAYAYFKRTEGTLADVI
jgi:lipopolysaccharide transport system permease protein